MSTQLILLSVMRNARANLIEVVYLYRQGNLEITAHGVREVLTELPDNQQAKTTVQFLLNMVRHTVLFDALVKSAVSSTRKGEEQTEADYSKACLAKAINTLKAMENLKGALSGSLAFEFFKSETEVSEGLEIVASNTQVTPKKLSN